MHCCQNDIEPGSKFEPLYRNKLQNGGRKCQSRRQSDIKIRT